MPPGPDGTAVGPRSCQTSSTLFRVPASIEPSTRWRRNSGFPQEDSHIRSADSPSRRPPTTASTSLTLCSLEKGCSSIRRRYPSFHSEVTASGTGSPLRTVARIRPDWSTAIWCNNVAERSSSRWASSTPTMLFPWDTRDSRAEASRAVASRLGDVPTRWANTPSGMLRDDSVDATQCTWVRSDSVTARASVVFPTPASPTSTTPHDSLPVSADRTAPNSEGRSTICQTCAMPWSLDRRRRQFSPLPLALAEGRDRGTHSGQPERSFGST